MRQPCSKKLGKNWVKKNVEKFLRNGGKKCAQNRSKNWSNRRLKKIVEKIGKKVVEKWV